MVDDTALNVCAAPPVSAFFSVCRVASPLAVCPSWSYCHLVSLHVDAIGEVLGALVAGPVAFAGTGALIGDAASTGLGEVPAGGAATAVCESSTMYTGPAPALAVGFAAGEALTDGDGEAVDAETDICELAEPALKNPTKFAPSWLKAPTRTAATPAEATAAACFLLTLSRAKTVCPPATCDPRRTDSSGFDLVG